MNLNKRHIKWLVIICLLLCNQQILASELKEHTKIWAFSNLSGAITADKKWNYYIQPQLRLIDDKYKFNQAIVRAGVYYQVYSNLSYWMGIYREYVLESNGKSSQEYRLWEQVVWNIINKDSFKLTSRSLLEERKDFASSAIANRFRERLLFAIPITHWNDYFLIITDEVFLQINQPNWVVNRVLAQNRASIGIQIPINKCAHYEVGYLNQFQYGNPNQMSNVAYVNLSVSMS